MKDEPFKTAEEARRHGARFYFTGKPCKRGHVAPRYAKSWMCTVCAYEHQVVRSPEEQAERTAAAKAWRHRNRERARQHAAAHYKRAREAVLETNRRWRARNRRVCTVLSRMSRAAIRRATPPWADVKAIRRFYLDRPDGMEVDHMVPLVGRTVCGLHVVWNLQYLTRSQNASKGNKLMGEAG